MRRLLLIAGLLAAAPAFAVGVVAPFPRLAQPEGSPPDAAPPAGDEDPLKVIERITKAARAVGDKLHDEDSGADTQKTQEQLLKDIDSLLKPPPPMGGGGGGSPPPPMNNDGNPPPQGGGGGGSPPPQGGGNPPPMGGGGNSSKRPRGDRNKEQGGSGEKQPMPMGGSGMKDPMPMGGKPDPKEPPMPGGGGGSDSKPMGGNQAGKGGKGTPPELPLDDPFTKRVWGHLPEKVRQQAMQSYREQFMPRYSEMLKQYYSTLNEKQNLAK